MEFGEGVLCGAGELELDPEIVSEEAGKVYSELQSVIETHGTDVVEPLVPILVWVLEGLASCRAQLRESEKEAEREKAEREELLERFQSERALRKESQERYLELDDQFEQERRTMRGREKERERRERELERKAREQADQLVALEEQKAGLTRDLNALKHTHNKLLHSYRELLDRRKDYERGEGSLSPISHRHPKTSDVSSDHASVMQAKVRAETPPIPGHTEPPSGEEDRAKDEARLTEAKSRTSSFIDAIVSSTPELVQLDCLVSTTRAELEHTTDPAQAEPGDSVKQHPGSEGADSEEGEDEDDSLEWELRNTDSVFSELSELSREYVESVDQGASVRGSTDQFEEILSQYEELKRTNEQIDSARKSLICRVEELTNERTLLSLEVESCRETITRLEGRVREMEDETKRLRKELEQIQREDSELSGPTSLRRFSRSEMARVVMEKNQYKERLFELQEAVRRSELLRATKEERSTEERKTTLWKRFNRLFGLTKDPLAVPAGGGSSFPPQTPARTVSLQTPRQLTVGHTQTDGSPPTTPSPRVRRRELYRDIRTHVWNTLGKRQIHGWSLPVPQEMTKLCGCDDHIFQDDSRTPSEPKDVPVLVQLRLLDQRDAAAKLTCAVAVTPDISREPACSVWVVSGPASSSDVTVIDPARANTVLDQFSLPPTSPALCLCAVPPTGESPGTVWFGTQDGSILVHSASLARRCCLKSVSLAEGVHSLTYFQGQVIAGLANGSLLFFTQNSGKWNLRTQDAIVLGSNPVQPIRCVLARETRLWVGYWNNIHVIDVNSRKVEHSFSVSERREQQVRFLCSAGSGVWASCRLDAVLRLFDWSTCRPLQQVDLTQLVTNALGPAFLSSCPLQISSLAIICGRLWLGTGSGAIFSIPVLLSSESASIPYCSLPGAQLCYHGHRQAVKFIVSAAGCLNPSATAGISVSTPHLILSGGEGYINFRIGDDGSDNSPDALHQRSERSHMIIWQSSSPSVPSPSL
ncbi:C-Jun-amino-terminal kinase-interacting protein 3 isoform X2 [Scleropages formosus]|uniref:C-Jun-amino-terminal kinase-interacting protein 3 isoform X2 n=1 Tax=Scleropages formosus TaxID=113540 RepID=UPI000878ADEA|nr:C-Jun-amino-terminal kinase-interacting protein 3-like isoform X2 [Scleropages formosus]